MNFEQKGNAAVSWVKGTKHKFYEDRYRLLPKEVPLVKKAGRGELFAVFDGIGSAPKGMNAAQEICDRLPDFFRDGQYPCSWGGMNQLLLDANRDINAWGMMPGTDRPLGGCAGTVVWLYGLTLYVFHAGDTCTLLIRDGKPRQLTRLHEKDGAIFSYFGLGSYLEIDGEQVNWEDSDRILLISDGVTKVFNPLEAAEFVDEFGDIGQAASELVRQSRLKGSIDDITALLLELEEPY
jgi:PPM family protein phosphatase